MDEAIALTWKTMTDRLRNLRFGAIAGLGSLLLLLVAAIVFRSFWVLAGLPILVLVGILFAHREQKLIFAWEDRILELWGASSLCMGILIQTLENHPHTLKKSLHSLAASLPPNPDYLIPPSGHIADHRRLFWTRSLLQRCRFRRAAALRMIFACLPLCIWIAYRQGWPWALGLSPLAALPLAGPLTAWPAFRAWKNRMAGLDRTVQAAEDGKAGERLPGFSSRLDNLDWNRIPAGTRSAIRGRLQRDQKDG